MSAITNRKLPIVSSGAFFMQEYSEELVTESNKLAHGTVSAVSMVIGLRDAEPLIICFEAMLRYAKAHEKRFESKLNEDYFIGPAYLEIVKGLRALLNGDGAVAHERGITTDSKDNGVLEGMFWHCMKASGFTEADL